MRRELLADEAIAERLRARPEWRREGEALVRELTFEDFNEAFGFMTRVALVAERLDHHPDWSNAYHRVRIALSTHDVGGITALDFDLAARIDAVL